MKIGICSDSHDNLPNLQKAMLEFQRRGVEAVIHAGDFVAPFTIDSLKMAKCPVYGVFGNCDGERLGLTNRFAEIGEIQTEPHICEIAGLKIVVMHHPHWVEAFAHESLADIIIYGHLHKLALEKRPPWIINPGEVFGRLSGAATVVLFDTELNKPEVIDLDRLS